jgi:hypothetical protein
MVQKSAFVVGAKLTWGGVIADSIGDFGKCFTSKS